MKVATERFTVSVVLVAALLLPSVALAQVKRVPTHDWSDLTAVTNGSKLAIKLKNGKTVEGKMSSVSDTALSS